MDFDSYIKIKKGNGKHIQSLIEAHSKKAWFICYHLTEDVTKAAPLFIQAFCETITAIAAAASAPGDDFSRLVFSTIYKDSLSAIESDLDYQNTPIPQVEEKYTPFIREFACMTKEIRSLYILKTYTDLSVPALAAISSLSVSRVKAQLKEAADTIAKEKPPQDIQGGMSRIVLFTEFRNPNDSGFSAVQVPAFLITSLIHKIGKTINNASTGTRKEAFHMANKTTKAQSIDPKAGSTKGPITKKGIAVCAIAAVAIILGAIFLPKLFGNNGTLTSITSYTVEAITMGDVDTTISGSGTLTPVSKDTIATTRAGTITALHYEVGATVEEDAVIAVLTDANGNDISFTAPYAGVLIELPIAVDDELTANSQIAMIMGTDGFTMGIAVDELDISTVKVGQEVSFTIDAVDGDYTGSVTAVSYNGSSSSGTTAYQITAKVAYIEGVYPGMSASAEIVIESSGEGLLVPTSAIRTSGDENYIYLAPSDAEEGSEYAEDALSIDDLTKVIVETGMSDGSYTIVESDEIQEGDLIVIVTLTSTQTGSDSEGQGGFGGMGGFGGGRGPGGGGMDFGDFDFENFDPGNMPGGGFGGFGG